jgi:hypothetical protein
MAIEITPNAAAARESVLRDTTTYRTPLAAIRWGAIVAGLAVGIATNLFLMLLGAAAGLAVLDVGDSAEGGVMAAAIWNAVSMIIAAFAGAYVAARSAGLRRTADGVLHGVVAWGVTMLISAFLLTSLAGTAFGAVLGASTGSQRSAGADIARKIDEGSRQDAIASLRDRLNISRDQASRLVDQALALSGNEDAASSEGRAAAQDTLRTASMASGWLSGAILLSLFAAMGGGMLGARGTRREVRRTPVMTGHGTAPL